MNMNDMFTKLESEKLSFLKRIKQDLEPHFKYVGELIICDDSIDLKYEGNLHPIVYINNEYTVSNVNPDIYEELYISPDEIFEQVGVGLSEADIQVKELSQFNIKQWLQYFSDKYERLGIDKCGNVRLNQHIVISSEGNVNHNEWHMNLFYGEHDLFSFKGSHRFNIRTQDLADEFERVFTIMYDYIIMVDDGKPGLNKYNCIVVE